CRAGSRPRKARASFSRCGYRLLDADTNVGKRRFGIPARGRPQRVCPAAGSTFTSCMVSAMGPLAPISTARTSKKPVGTFLTSTVVVFCEFLPSRGIWLERLNVGESISMLSIRFSSPSSAVPAGMRLLDCNMMFALNAASDSSIQKKKAEAKVLTDRELRRCRKSKRNRSHQFTPEDAPEHRRKCCEDVIGTSRRGHIAAPASCVAALIERSFIREE